MRIEVKAENMTAVETKLSTEVDPEVEILIQVESQRFLPFYQLYSFVKKNVGFKFQRLSTDFQVSPVKLIDIKTLYNT